MQPDSLSSGHGFYLSVHNSAANCLTGLSKTKPCSLPYSMHHSHTGCLTACLPCARHADCGCHATALNVNCAIVLYLCCAGSPLALGRHCTNIVALTLNLVLIWMEKSVWGKSKSVRKNQTLYEQPLYLVGENLNM